MAREQGLAIEVASAGTESYHIGEAPHRFSQEVCRANGINISNQRAIRFTFRHFEEYDLIFAMADDVYHEISRIGRAKADMSKVAYFMNVLRPGGNESVPDPYYGGRDGFDEVFALIDEVCTCFVDNFKKNNNVQ